MTTQQLIWTCAGLTGLLAFMTFMYGITRAKYLEQVERHAYDKAVNALRQSSIDELEEQLATEKKLRQETSAQLYDCALELKNTQAKVSTRGSNGRSKL